MTDALQFDEKALLHLESTYRAPEVAAQRRALMETIAPRAGERALDIGCGPGFVTEDLARAVGNDGAVHAIDISDSSVVMTRRRCAEFPQVQVQVADATLLPYPDAHFDLAVSTQVYEYVPDLPLALSELRRVLRNGGRAAIIDTDWHSILWHSSDPARMARILKVWDVHVAHPVLPRTLGPLLRSAGFSLLDCKVVPYLDVTYRPENYSFHMTKTIRGFVRGRHGITREDADTWAREFQELADNGAYFFCLSRFLFLAEKR